MSLAAFSNFQGAPLATSGEPERRWIEHRGREVPAVLGGDDFGLAVRLRELSGAAVSAAYGYAGGDHGGPPADFQVIAVPASGEKIVLFRDRPPVEDRARWHALRAPVRGRVSGPGWLRLEVIYGDGARAEGRPAGGWLDPVVEMPRKHRLRPVERPRNLVLITADTTRLDFLGLCGGPAHTPALERLAEDGVTFLQAHTVATGTTPSHASLFTGLPSRQHGVYTNSHVLGRDAVTLAEVLERAGYATAAFVAARPLARAVGLDQGFRWFDDVFSGSDESGIFGRRFWRHERGAERVVSRFQQWLDSETFDTPFAVWIHFFDPHQPYALHTPNPTGESADLTRLFADEDGPKLVYARDLRPETPVSFEELDREAQRRYTAEIEYLDSQLGRLLDDLRRRRLYDRSVVLFLSDHGENFGDREAAAAFHHAGLHGEVTRLAMVLKLPGSHLGGTRESALVPSSDIPCTLLDIVGGRRPESWPCRSFLELMQDPGAAGEYRSHLILEGANRQEIAVRTPRYLFRALRAEAAADDRLYGPAAFRPGQPAELYDLSRDPRETLNVFDQQQHRAQAARLRQVLDDFLQGSPQRTQPTLENPEHLSGLKALGYLD